MRWRDLSLPVRFFPTSATCKLNGFLAYPEPDRRGRMLGLWVFMRNAAPVIGAHLYFENFVV
jgi:hypothetical protein